MSISLLFLIIAAFYSAVGFGGGSSYIAILALYEYPYESIPILALICNLIVVSGGCVFFYRRGHFKSQIFWPYAASSIPMSFIGGMIPITKETFLWFLGTCLLLVGLRLLVVDRIKSNYPNPRNPHLGITLSIGAALGLLSGLVGIGGGIFLAPILLLMEWGNPKQISATAAFFILSNSVFGLLGQLMKNASQFSLTSHWPLFLAVLIGGQIGSRMGSGSILSQRIVKNLTAILILFVGIRILVV